MLRQQVMKWKTAKCLHFQGLLGFKSLFTCSTLKCDRDPPVKGENIFSQSDPTKNAETGDLLEADDAVSKIHSSYKGLGRSPRRTLEKSQFLNARSRCGSKEEVEQLEDETYSCPEEYAQSKGDQNQRNLAAQYDIEASSKDISDAMDEAKELETMMDASDMSSYVDRVQSEDMSEMDNVKELEAVNASDVFSDDDRAYPEDTSDATEDVKELEAMMDASDTDSDGDGARIITPLEIFRGVEKDAFNKLSEKEQEKIRRKTMDQLISAALDEPEEVEDGSIREDEQRSLRVGIIGAVNAGKSSLTNFMVGTKVAAVSRKRNTTLSEILGVITKGKTQILLYDTPGLVLDILGKPSKTDTRRRSESAWQLFSHCEVLLVLVDAYRQIHKPDKRVLSLVERLGSEEQSHIKKALVLNKVDIVENKKQLLPLAQQFGELPGYESIFMVSALTGSGIKDIVNYLTDQAVLRPWEEEPNPLNEETIKTLSMEVVREHLLDRVHEEIPYELDHQLVDWQELEDGSLRVEQHFYLPKKGQCRIVVGKGGSKIREIGIKACEELRKLLDRKVHLFLEVKHGGGF